MVVSGGLLLLTQSVYSVICVEFCVYARVYLVVSGGLWLLTASVYSVVCVEFAFMREFLWLLAASYCHLLRCFSRCLRQVCVYAIVDLVVSGDFCYLLRVLLTLYASSLRLGESFFGC